LVPDGRRAIIDRTLGAAFLDEHRVVGQADDNSFAKSPCRRIFDWLARGLVENFKNLVERVAQGVRLCPAG
jgi:hypothetical protein